MRKLGYFGSLVRGALLATITAAVVAAPMIASAAGFGDSGGSGTFNLADWAVDRYAPGGWAPNSTDPLSGNALKISIANADRKDLRPGAYNSDFYNTQGRVRLSPGVTEVGGKLFIPASWGTPGNLRRSDIWSRDNNPAEPNSRYLICGFINNDPADPFNPLAGGFAPRFRAWDSTVGWTDLSAPVLYGQYNTIRMVDTGYQHEYYINGALVQVNSGAAYSEPGWNGLKQVILQGYNFGNAGNSGSLPDSSYDIYWKDVYALGGGNSGIPVDLNGSYAATGTFYDILNDIYYDGRANATTNSAGDTGANGQVFEMATGVAALEGTFTPFSDGLKAPTVLQGLDMRGKNFSADVDLGPVSGWTDPDVGFGGEWFQLGLGREVYTDGGEESFAFIYRNDNKFSIYYSSDWTDYALPGCQYDADPAATKFRISVDINPAGTEATMTVTPLDGPDAMNPTTLDPFPLQMEDNVTSASFFAGFTSNGYGNETGRAVVSNFKTNATTNSQFVFAADPYNKSSENVNYAVGQANLNVQVGGFQAFLQSNNLAGSMGFTSGSYTSSPYPNHYNPTITGSGDLTGYIALNAALTSGDFTLANILMNGAHGTRGYINIKPDNGGGLDSQFNDGDGNPYLADRRTSNIAMFDDVNPVVGGVTATQSGNPGCPNPVMTGMMNIQVASSDALTGLDRQPTISLDFAPLGPSLGDVTLTTYSIAGNNFGASYNVPNSAPNGIGRIVVTAVDRAGNSTTTFTPMNVNTATLTVNITLQGVTAPSITRGIEILLGGPLGSGSQLTLNRNVVFTAGSGSYTFTALDGLPNTVGATYSVGVKDTLHTLRSTVPAPGVGNQYVANANGPKALRGGNLNTDNKIDIGDYVVYATRYGIPVSPNTPFSTLTGPPHAALVRHADISGDGNVDNADFSYISAGFATQFDDAAPSFFARDDRTIRTKITVADAVREAGKEAAKLDLNGDGVITMDEIQKFLTGRRR